MLSKISQKRQKEIKDKLPVDIEEIERQIMLANPDLVASLGRYGERFSIATICLQDSAIVATQAVQAIGEGPGSLVWFREDAPNAPVKYADGFSLAITRTMRHCAYTPRQRILRRLRRSF